MINKDERIWRPITVTLLPRGWWAEGRTEDGSTFRVPVVALLSEELRDPRSITIGDARTVFAVEENGDLLPAAEALGAGIRIHFDPALSAV